MSHPERLSALRSSAIAASVVWALTLLLPYIGLLAPIGMLAHLSVFFNRGDPWARNGVARGYLRLVAWLQVALAGVMGVLSITVISHFLQNGDRSSVSFGAIIGVAAVAIVVSEIRFVLAVERVLQRGAEQAPALQTPRV
jgi:hypothetical protein